LDGTAVAAGNCAIFSAHRILAKHNAPFGLSVSKSGQCVSVAEVIRDEALWREEPVEVEAADWSYPRGGD
jgi:hypothetical protein